MRGRIGLLMNPSSTGSTAIIGRTSKVASFCAFSSSSGGDGGGGDGGGRGRGRGGTSNSPLYNFVAGKTDSNDEFHDSNDQSSGRGHGRGKPLPSAPFLPSFNSFVAPDPQPQQSGLSRGRGGPIRQSSEAGSEPKRPIFLKKDESTGTSSEADFVASEPRQPIGERNLPDNILNVLSGTGRGKPERKPVSETRVAEENRHLRRRQAPAPAPGAGREGERVPKGDVESGKAGASASASARPKLSREEATKKAVGILSKGDDGRAGGPAERGGGRRRRGAKSKDDDDSDDEADAEDDLDKAAFVGDDADGEKLAKGLGPALMADLTEAFDEMSSEVFPDPVEDEYLEAYDTNLKIELEPEYLMGDLETNPDLNEKPPIPLREALEKMKPFLMAYEGIESQEEWEEVIKETMERVPLLKEIVDHYCGPDRVTAKQQHEELERVAKTLPPSVPNSVKRFTDRAVLSLQSNPGWGFHRKYQFMDKLVDEVSKSQK
ncbi:tRNA uridine 5-carboxymethylaminomethyl modification enzyme MnmG [Bienertia sinuspersici]